jgi:hypothetical protein
MKKVRCVARRTHLASQWYKVRCSHFAKNELNGIALCDIHYRQALHWQYRDEFEKKVSELWGINVGTKK